MGGVHAGKMDEELTVSLFNMAQCRSSFISSFAGSTDVRSYPGLNLTFLCHLPSYMYAVLSIDRPCRHRYASYHAIFMQS